VVQCSPSKHETLNSSPSTAKKRRTRTRRRRKRRSGGGHRLFVVTVEKTEKLNTSAGRRTDVSNRGNTYEFFSDCF
jgi:hypothetical protein